MPKRKKPKRTTLNNKLDREFSVRIRSRGYCEKCGETKDDQLQCCHIFSRRYRAVRWDDLNALCLCAKCHFWGHDNPILFSEFVRDHLGLAKYLLLKSRAISIRKWTIVELEELFNSLRESNYGGGQ